LYNKFCSACNIFLFRLYSRSSHKWLLLDQKTCRPFLTIGKHKNSIRVYSRLLPLKIWSHAFKRWWIDTTTLYVISANARKEFSPYICYRSSAPSVSKATLAFTGANVALLRYGWVDNWNAPIVSLFVWESSHFYPSNCVLIISANNATVVCCLNLDLIYLDICIFKMIL